MMFLLMTRGSIQLDRLSCCHDKNLLRRWDLGFETTTQQIKLNPYTPITVVILSIKISTNNKSKGNQVTVSRFPPNNKNE